MNPDHTPGYWLQLAISAAGAEAALIEEVLHDAGALAVTLEDAGDEACFESQPASLPVGNAPWQATRIVGLFAADCDTDAVLQRLCHALRRETPPPHQISRLADRAWERVWLERFQPMRFGRRLWICPGGQTPPDPAAVNLFLDPGLAFGTGTHPTTALCLAWLDAAPLAGRTVLDYGCGSGILAVAAVRLGAAGAWAVDIDPQALAATRANAARNGVAAQIHTALPEHLPGLKTDCVLANILADSLCELAPRLAGHLRPGGHLVLSGILENQARAVIDAYRPWFEDFRTCSQEEWLRITARRNP